MIARAWVAELLTALRARHGAAPLAGGRQW